MNDVEPPALLMTSESSQLIATVFVPPWRIILTPMRVRSAGAVGRVSVTAAEVVSTGTKSPAASV